MVRAPCCEKMGLKKGPWSSEEDHILISYIQKHGHGNWKALPELAGLLRCGKSCRLRWTNYLRPDVKRGNFTREEEDEIIILHQILGNRWSAIAAKLPGRTDNEIKNVWHTHLKKRLNNEESTQSESKRKTIQKDSKLNMNSTPLPTQESCSDVFFSDAEYSSTSTAENNQISSMESLKQTVFEEINESFWTETMQMDSVTVEGFSSDVSDEAFFFSDGWRDEDDSSFWIRVLLQAEELQGLAEI